MATIIDKMVKSGLSAFDTLKSGGTPTQALASANRTYQSKPGDVSSSQMASAAPVTSVSNLPSVPKVITNAINAGLKSGTSAFNTIKSGGTTQEALTNANNTLTNGLTGKSTTSQPVQQVAAVDPNLATQLQDLIKALQQNNQPKAIPQYQSQYSGQISDLINQFNSRPEFQFDATNNPTILANQKKAADAVTQEMGRRNILQSSITGNEMADRIAEVYATIAPQLEQQAFNQDQALRQNDLQKIQNLMNLDNTDYNRYVNSYNMGQDASQNQFNNTMSIADLINQLDVQNYNKTQDSIANATNTANQTGYYNPYAGVTISPEVQQYAGDYQAEIDRRRATPDTSDDYLISQLEAARANKIFSSPDLLEKYGDQYKTAEQKAIELNAQIEAQKLALQNDPNSIENQLQYMKLAQAQEELNQLATYGPQEAAAKIKQIESQIAQNNASASASYASANASNALATQRLNNTDGEEKFTTADKNVFYLDAIESIKNNPTNAVADVTALRDYLLKTIKMSLSEYNSLLEAAKKIETINKQTDSLNAITNPLSSVLKGQISQALGR